MVLVMVGVVEDHIMEVVATMVVGVVIMLVECRGMGLHHLNMDSKMEKKVIWGMNLEASLDKISMN